MEDRVEKSEWPVFERYAIAKRPEIVGKLMEYGTGEKPGSLKYLESGGRVVKTYRPADYPEIAMSLAYLWNMEDECLDEKRLLQFASKWGSLGYGVCDPKTFSPHLLGSVEATEVFLRDNRDPLDWVAAHAYGVRVCLDLLWLLGGHDTDALRQYIGKLFVGSRTENPPWALGMKLTWHLLFHPVGRVDQTLNEYSGSPLGNQRDVARDIVSWIVSPNLAGIRQGLVVTDRRFRLKAEGSLVGMAYWHLAQMASDMVNVRQCPCGRYFVPSDARQMYCPPSEGRTESKCAKRFRMRRLRNGKEAQGEQGA